MKLICHLCDEIYPEHECPIGRAGLDLCPKCEEPVTPYVEPELHFSSAVTGEPKFMASIPTTDRDKRLLAGMVKESETPFRRKQAGS